MMFPCKLILLMMNCFLWPSLQQSTTITRKTKISHKILEPSTFPSNTISTSSLVVLSVEANEIIADSTTSTIAPTPSSTSRNVYSNKSSTITLNALLSPLSTETSMTLITSLEPTTSHSETPINTDSLKLDKIYPVDRISSTTTTSGVSPTRNDSSSKTPQKPILIAGIKVSQRSRTPILKPDEVVPQKFSAAPVLPQQEELALTLQPSELVLTSSSFGYYQTTMDFSTPNILLSDQSVSPYGMTIDDQSTKTRRAPKGENVPEYKTILTSTQTTIDTKCPTGDCLDLNPRGRGTPNLIQNSTMVDTFLGPRQFDCKFTVDIPKIVCQEKMIQTELFYCIHWIPSCRGNCGKVLDSCSCDINCGIYNTCCDDFEDVCSDIFEDAKRSLGGLLGVKIECVGEYNSYLVIAGCPQNYTSPDLKLGCEDGEILINSINGLHFKNVACLRCNGFTEVESEKWTLSVYVNYGRGKQASFFAGLDLKKDTKILTSIWEVPEKVFNVTRVCSPRTIEKCPTGSDGNLVEKCSTSKGNVLVNSQNTINIFKNIYCADCHTKSDYFCRGTSKYDYKTVMRIGRFSSVISLTFDHKSERFELESAKPFMWRKALCTGPVNKLNCIITKCFIDIPPVNNTCGLDRTETCVWMEFSTSSEASKTDLMHFISMMFNVSLRRSDVEIERTIYSYDYTNRSLKYRLVFTTWSGAFPYTLDDLYEHYSSLANDLLMERRLEGEFSLCFNIIHEMTDCSNLKCETRNYTIQEPSNQGNVSNGGDRLLNRSHDGNKLPVYFCLFHVSVAMYRIFAVV